MTPDQERHAENMRERNARTVQGRKTTAYRCGYDPEGKSLAHTAAHWQTCSDKECRAAWNRWLQLRAELGRKRGILRNSTEETMLT
jgi:hypothetical protein